MTGFIRKIITRRIVAKIAISFRWMDVGTRTDATYFLTETIFGGRSWFLAGNVWPAAADEHQRFADVMLWVKNGELTINTIQIGEAP
jgi:hypothetical protein